MKYDSIQYLKSQLINHADDEMFNRTDDYYTDADVEKLAEERISDIQKYFEKFEVTAGSISADKSNIKFEATGIEGFRYITVSISTDLQDKKTILTGCKILSKEFTGTKTKSIRTYISTDDKKTKINFLLRNEIQHDATDGLYTITINRDVPELDISFYDRSADSNLDYSFNLKGAQITMDKDSLAQLGFSPDKEASYKIGENVSDAEVIYWLLSNWKIEEFLGHLITENEKTR